MDFGVVVVVEFEVGMDIGVDIVRGGMGTEEDDFVFVLLPLVFSLFCDKPLLLFRVDRLSESSLVVFCYCCFLALLSTMRVR